jgi:hypothetical protein
MPIKLVTVNPICITTMPVACVIKPNAIHPKLDMRNKTKPHPEWRLFNARSNAPHKPVMHPAHSIISSIYPPFPIFRVCRSALVFFFFPLYAGSLFCVFISFSDAEN